MNPDSLTIGSTKPYVIPVPPANENPGRPEDCFRVGPSRIAGQGAFATRPIDRGEWIIEYAGERISEAEFQRRDPARRPGEAHHTVFFEVAPDVVIDASVGGNDARFINHSCDPNCETRIEHGRVHIYAKRRINGGEELCFDYSYVWEPHHTPEMIAAHPCHCGSAKCRGTLFADAVK
jgi:SET domain-containing protein